MRCLNYANSEEETRYYTHNNCKSTQYVTYYHIPNSSARRASQQSNEALGLKSSYSPNLGRVEDPIQTVS